MSPWSWLRQSYCGTIALALLVASCGGGGSDPDEVPTEVQLNSDDVSLDAGGQSFQLTATVLDQNGDPIAGAALTWASGDAGIATVSGTGLVVAQGAGTTEITATSGEIEGSATVTVDSDASMVLVEGNGQSVDPGALVPTAPAVRVRDESDNPVAGVQVIFEAATGSGTVSGGTQTTGADGIARVGSWRVGSGSGIHTLTATVEGVELNGEPVEFQAVVSGFDITLNYLSTLTGTQQLAFENARDRWQTLIVGDLPDVNQDLDADMCAANPTVNGPFDDLTIFVTVEPIDGPGSILGQAGPCFVRVPGRQTVIGQMTFDSEDMEVIEQQDLMEEVVLHEMGHVLGFGTLWGPAPQGFDLLRDAAPADDTPPLLDTHFVGAQAIIAFNDRGGSSYSGAKVPVMNEGPAGTVNSHWRENLFGAELMTGFVDAGFNPLSAISVRSMQDLGYTVSVAGADDYTFNPTLRVAGPRRGLLMMNDISPEPIRQVDIHRVGGVMSR
jgi:Leishmanolysin/Bacterial Ig-like domain (group 2)